MISYPDTIIFDPTLADFQNAPNETYSGGRLMNALPHTDGLIFLPAGQLLTDSSNLVLTRNAAGNWVLSRTAAGAETYHIVACLNDASILRTGETYNLGEFPGTNQTTAPSAGPKGIKVLDIFAVLNIGVVNLTSATLGLTQSIYPKAGAAAAAPTITNIVPATNIPTATVGAGLFVTNLVPVSSPSFSVSDISLLETELTITMANTGTVAIAGIGAHVAFNYD
jgi:hypothetical protein